VNRWRCWVLLLLLWAGAGRGEEGDYGFEVLKAELVPVGETYVLNADVDFRFSEPALEALENGVPLTLAMRLKVKRYRGWWMDATVYSEKRKFIVRYHPLAKSYQILQETSGVPQNFASRSALLAAMGEIRGWRALPVTSLEPGEEYWAFFSVNLDIEALPLPLRPIAYVSPSWYLGSPWFQWPVEP
jgi:hypothetical protein